MRFSATVAGGAARKGTFALKGRGATGPADPSPLPVIAGSDVERVAPLATIALDGSQSAACTGTIAAYAWTVEGPPGTAPVLTPGASAAAVQCVPTVVGDYTFRLSVRDSEGRESAEPAALRVEVRPDTRLHVELTWRTPLDPDETDEGPETGSDVDLHFAHEQAGGEPDLDGDGAPDPWFDTTFDCFWFNRSPAWDPGGKANPVLDRDDFDGGGPEIVSVAEPETGGTYRIAVHYWSDHDYGEAFATLRVYVDGALAYEEADVRLTNRALWFVGTVSWPSGAVTPVRDSGQRRITPDYQNPDFFQP